MPIFYKRPTRHPHPSKIHRKTNTPGIPPHQRREFVAYGPFPTRAYSRSAPMRITGYVCSVGKQIPYINIGNFPVNTTTFRFEKTHHPSSDTHGDAQTNVNSTTHWDAQANVKSTVFRPCASSSFCGSRASFAPGTMGTSGKYTSLIKHSTLPHVSIF